MDRSPAQTALLPASQALDPSRSVPAVLERAGANALFAADEFFAARISNPHTRRAYARVVRRFLAWCEDNGLELPQVSPGLAGRFIDELPGDSPTKNQALATLQHCPQQAEAQDDEAEAGWVPEAIRRPAVLGGAQPATALVSPASPTPGPAGRPRRRCALPGPRRR